MVSDQLDSGEENKIMGVYEELGVKKLINAFGPVTKVGGSLMSAEVIEAMAEAARSFWMWMNSHLSLICISSPIWERI